MQLSPRPPQYCKKGQSVGSSATLGGGCYVALRDSCEGLETLVIGSTQATPSLSLSSSYDDANFPNYSIRKGGLGELTSHGLSTELSLLGLVSKSKRLPEVLSFASVSLPPLKTHQQITFLETE